MSDQAQSSTETAASRLPLIGLLLVQAFVGYEWFMSGLTKIYRGGFPGGSQMSSARSRRAQPVGTRASSTAA